MNPLAFIKYVFSINPLAMEPQEAQAIHMTARFTHNVSRVVPHFSSIHLSPQIQLHISMDQELHSAEQFANLIKPLLKSFACIEQFQSSLCSWLALICIWIHSNLTKLPRVILEQGFGCRNKHIPLKLQYKL